jgi:hypothetical protein
MSMAMKLISAFAWGFTLCVAINTGNLGMWLAVIANTIFLTYSWR